MGDDHEPVEVFRACHSIDVASAALIRIISIGRRSTRPAAARIERDDAPLGGDHGQQLGPLAGDT
jgi:hypothetical protein